MKTGTHCLSFRSCLVGLALGLNIYSVHAQETTLPVSPAPADARVYILSPVVGEVVPQTFKVVFGLSGMGVAPAGVPRDNTGHHHILIDLDELPDLSKPLPSSANVIHFGGGQTETWLTLEPGEHSLQLLLGNHLHLPHSPPVLSEKVKITVKKL